MSIKKTHKELERFIESVNPYAGRVGLAYARVSGRRQETEGSGLDSQEKRCLDDLLSQNIPHHKTFRDTFSGGGDFMKRPAMRALLTYIDANPHKKFVVVFDDLKRFARDAMFHFKLKIEFKKRDVLLRCLNYKFDDSDEGQFVELIMSGQAELERKQNRRQVIQKMKACLERGYEPFARRRGYDRIKDHTGSKTLVPNKEGLLIKQALEKFAKGDFIRKVDVARFLHKQGYWKHSKRSAEDYLDDVSDMLNDVFHAGYIEYPDWGVSRRKGVHKGVISLDTFELIQKRLHKEETKARIRIDTSPEFPLRGLVLCPECQQKLTGTFSKGRTKRYPYYYCQAKGCGLYSKMIARDCVERDFRELLRQYRLKEDVSDVAELTFERVWKDEVSGFRQQQVLKTKQRESTEQKVRDLTELVRTARSEMLKNTYEAQLEEAAKDLDGLSREQNIDLKVPYRTALNKSIGMLKNPISIWDTVDTVEKHRLFFFLFDARLAYSKTVGYRTANKLATARVFEEFCDQNSADVDRSGFEPLTPSLQMRCSTTELTARAQKCIIKTFRVIAVVLLYGFKGRYRNLKITLVWRINRSGRLRTGTTSSALRSSR